MNAPKQLPKSSVAEIKSGLNDFINSEFERVDFENTRQFNIALSNILTSLNAQCAYVAGWYLEPENSTIVHGKISKAQIKTGAETCNDIVRHVIIQTTEVIMQKIPLASDEIRQAVRDFRQNCDKAVGIFETVISEYEKSAHASNHIGSVNVAKSGAATEVLRR